ncbi:hypothetical protein bcgnr5380_21200 [Bacillus cereus]
MNELEYKNFYDNCHKIIMCFIVKAAFHLRKNSFFVRKQCSENLKIKVIGANLFILKL